jgi:hypothetical protein
MSSTSVFYYEIENKKLNKTIIDLFSQNKEYTITLIISFNSYLYYNRTNEMTCVI